MGENNKSKNIPNIGLRQAARLCQMRYDRRLNFLADGLPIILDSARSLDNGARIEELTRRESEILFGLSAEESAKILIILDIARCPRKSVSRNISKLVKWFYSHLSRLIYCRAVTWKPTTIDMLQEYTEHERKTHYVDGFAGEHIYPNNGIFNRESRLYADIASLDGENLKWHSPTNMNDFGFSVSEHYVFQLVSSMDRLGMFTRKGLTIIANCWEKVDFSGETGCTEAKPILHETLEKLENAAQFQASVSDGDFQAVMDYWQMPMYNLNLDEIPVSMEEIESEQEALLSSEIGNIF